MKKVIFTGLFSLIVLSSFAQGPAAGSLFLFGTVGVTSERPAGTNTKSTGVFTFAPGAGYFLTDKIAVGGRLLYTKQFTSGQKGGSEAGLQVFGRYYLLHEMFSSKGGFFLEGNLGFSSAKPVYPDGAPTPKSVSTFGLGVGPGFALFPTQKIGFEFTLPNLLSFYVTSSGGNGSGGSGFGIGASTISMPSVTFMYFIK